MRRSAFTLIEMLISVVILSLVLVFLYNTLSKLQLSNTFFKSKVDELVFQEAIYKTLYLDLSMAKLDSIKIHNESKEFDTLFLQTPHSLHQRIMPYVAYIVKEETLYRIESLKPFKQPVENLEYDVAIDKILKIKNFRIYKSDTEYLIDYRKNSLDINPFRLKVYN